MNPNRRDLLKQIMAVSAFPLANSCGSANTEKKNSDTKSIQGNGERPSIHNLRYADLLEQGSIDSISIVEADPEKLTDLEPVLEDAITNNRPLRVSCGGHGYIGNSTTNEANAIIINLAKLNQVEIRKEADKSFAYIGAGCRFHDIMPIVHQFNLENHTQFVLPFGSCPTVGISGFTLGGGQGALSPHLGMMCDRVTEMEVLTYRINSDGTVVTEIVTVNAENHGDLYRALLGGTGRFGLVLRFKIELEDIGAKKLKIIQMGINQQVTEDKAAAIFKNFELNLIPVLENTTSVKYFIASWTDFDVKLIGTAKDVEAIESWIKSVVDGEELLTLSSGEFDLAEYTKFYSGCEINNCKFESYTHNPEYFAAKSVIVPHGAIKKADLVSALHPIKDGISNGAAFLQFSRFGGRITEEGKRGLNYFPHRNPGWEIQVYVKKNVSDCSFNYDGVLDDLVARLNVPGHGSYFNHLNKDVEGILSDANIQKQYFGSNWGALQEVKKLYDPKGVFETFKAAISDSEFFCLDTDSEID